MSVDTYTETTKIDKLLKKPTSHFQLSTTQLYNKILDNNEGVLTELGRQCKYWKIYWSFA